ncbi:alanine/glycine:cation symporter family protein [Vibrio sp. YIC-376]|uniref:alanine/glycine:cation symporter family protein n=1 Tax=Vibrio sp. YIC-376 TaxID=3136162 RepID=UPI00402A8F41
MNIETLVNNINSAIWAMPVILLLLFVSLAYMIAMRFGTLTKPRLQFRLLRSGSESADGISPFETFCSVAAYRIAVGNIGGVCVAIMYGGPGAVLWMLITSVITSALAFAENSLGQVYKVRQDGQFRGGPYNYIESGLGWKPVAVLFALLALIGVPLFVSGAGANNIGMAFESSMGISPVISGAIVSVLLFLVISGGIRRIAKFSTLIVPVMAAFYFVITLVVLGANLHAIPDTLELILSSALGSDAAFGGLFGSALVYGVKRAVNSSGAGMGETPATAAAAECKHPAEQGMINAFTVYIDVAVCLCTAFLILITDCFNVIGTNDYIYIGQGSQVMAEQAAANSVGVIWVQEAVNSVLPGLGGIVVAVSLLFFVFSTTIAYYYEGESGLAYLARNISDSVREKMIWVLRVLMCVMFFMWFNVTAGIAWAVSEIGLGVMIWVNGIALIFLFPQVIKVYNDYISQLDSGKEPHFNPRSLGIKNADLWLEINKSHIEKSQTNREFEYDKSDVKKGSLLQQSGK